MREQLIEDIKKEEGFESKPYKDHLGYLTIGFGTLIEDGISREEAHELLKIRLNNSIKELEAAKPLVRTLPEKLRHVFYHMAYQLGVPKLLKFEKMWAAVQRDDKADIIAEMKDSRWYSQTPKRAERLIDIVRSI